MNDFDYDCLQKKRIAHSATRRKCGSKSRKCSLSTDHITAKEWKERNGRIVTANFDRPALWTDFIDLSKDVQEEYLHHLSDVFGANATNLAEMFGVNVRTIRKHIQENGLDIKFSPGHSMNSSQRAAWADFLSGDRENQPERSEAEQQESIQQIHTDTTMKMKQFSLCFSGNIEIDMIANSLKSILGKDAFGDIEIICDLKDRP